MGLYLLQAEGLDEAALGRSAIVRQGFSGAAVVWGPLWLLAHRLWLAAACWIAAEFAFLALAFNHLPGLVALAVALVVRLWLGTEAGALRARKTARRAACMDVIAASSAAEAEVRFIERCREPARALELSRGRDIDEADPAQGVPA